MQDSSTVKHDVRQVHASRYGSRHTHIRPRRVHEETVDLLEELLVADTILVLLCPRLAREQRRELAVKVDEVLGVLATLDFVLGTLRFRERGLSARQ